MKRILTVLILLNLTVLTGYAKDKKKAAVTIASDQALMATFQNVTGLTGEPTTVKKLVNVMLPAMSLGARGGVLKSAEPGRPVFYQRIFESKPFDVTVTLIVKNKDDDTPVSFTVVTKHYSNAFEGVIYSDFKEVYQAVTCDMDGRILEASEALNVDNLGKKPVFTAASRGSKIEPYWQFQTESAVKLAYEELYKALHPSP